MLYFVCALIAIGLILNFASLISKSHLAKNPYFPVFGNAVFFVANVINSFHTNGFIRILTIATAAFMVYMIVKGLRNIHANAE